jgi:hypothetical protein
VPDASPRHQPAPDDDTVLVLRLIGGDPGAPAHVRERAATSGTPDLLVAAALLTADAGLLERAGRCATTTRDRQLVCLAEAHLRGDADLLDVLVRDHLAEHPDHLLAAWLAGGRPPHHP